MATVSQAELKRRTLALMEDDLRVPPKNAQDFINSLKAVVEEAVENGDKVSLFGIATITPKGVLPKPKRKGTDPRTGEERTFDAQPAKLKVTATLSGSIKAALPATTTKAGKALLADAKQRKQAAEARAAAREAEAAKPAGKKSGRK